MGEKILLTGGAGFIGSHLADELLEAGHSVRILDSLVPQVHGKERRRPEYLNPEADLQQGDIRDRDVVVRALKGVDAVVHLAALVGVGQSMYQVREYTDVNETGTAVLLQALLEHPVRRLVTASSMSVYGEGLYRDDTGAPAEDVGRTQGQLARRQWDPVTENGRTLTPVPTPESKRPQLASVYALNKYAQERMTLIVGQSYGLDPVCLRYFNVYGTRQALSNPYTGVLAIFASRLLNGRSPVVFEDGEQRRDFIHVRDVARATRLALERSEAVGEVFNIGSGNAYPISFLARRLADVMGKEIQPEISGKYRVGDIRNCFADISKARELLGFEPHVALDEGLAELTQWLTGQNAEDRFDIMSLELAARGLAV